MNEVNPNNALQRETLGFALLTPTYGLTSIGGISLLAVN
jgi:hypothetical protein